MAGNGALFFWSVTNSMSRKELLGLLDSMTSRDNGRCKEKSEVRPGSVALFEVQVEKKDSKPPP
jgi:hypothetical protein